MQRAAIDLRRLRYFIAVCDHGGFSRASSAVGIAQPSLTRHIKLLEEELGFSLFDRGGHRAGPTEQGRLLRDRARPLLEGIEDAVREVRQRASTLSGDITLGVCPTIAPLFVADLQSVLEAVHPSVRMTVVEAYSGDLARMMSHGTIDMSLTYRPSDPRAVSFLEVGSEPLILVAPPGLDDGPRPFPLERIGGMRLILPSSIHELRRIIDAVSARRGVVLAPDIELDSLAAVKSMLLASGARHATILPLNSVSDDMAAGRLVGLAIDDPGMVRTIAIVVPRSSRMSPLTQAVSGLIQRRAASIDISA